MPEKKFEVGDVGQLVTGGTVNSGGNASVNNVVHLTVVSDKPSLISDFQRQALLSRLGEAVAATGITPTELRLELYASFGVNRVSDLPAGRFQEAMDFLGRWMKTPLRDGTQAVDLLAKSDRPASRTAAPRTPAALSPNLLIQFVHTRYLIALVGLVLTSVIIATGWAVSSRVPATSPGCEWEGKRYSVGSAVMMNGQKAVCTAKDVDSEIAVWQGG
ncbi:MAG: hypothetical protein HYV16_12120 [Gammaproteobacteria bacterium]|nr:hypothetical protein [Gammaproteobacteria bacterium]